MDHSRTPTEEDDVALRDAEQSREATAEGETPQDFESEHEAADAHPAFGDDKVTPRLNDGR